MNQKINREIEYLDLGLKDYKETWDYQTELFDAIIGIKLENRKNESLPPQETPNHLIFCEHPHVYTLGKSGDPSHLLATPEILQQREAVFYKINRGGDITYHGPGQLVGYPIFDLENFFTDIHKYLRLMEEAIIRTIAHYGLRGERFDGYTGVWLEADKPTARKICAMGVKSSRWVTMHGFALNVNSDLDYFNMIVPCGIDDKAVTSIEKELGKKVAMEEVKEIALKEFMQVFEGELIHS